MWTNNNWEGTRPVPVNNSTDSSEWLCWRKPKKISVSVHFPRDEGISGDNTVAKTSTALINGEICFHSNQYLNGKYSFIAQRHE